MNNRLEPLTSAARELKNKTPTLLHLINFTDRTWRLSHAITHRMSHSCMDCSHLAATFHWPESQLLCDQNTRSRDASRTWKESDWLNENHNTSRGGGGGGGGEFWGNSRPPPIDFLWSESKEETCRRSAASLSHTLLIVSGEDFKAGAERDAKKAPSGRKNTASASCELTRTSGLFLWNVLTLHMSVYLDIRIT